MFTRVNKNITIFPAQTPANRYLIGTQTLPNPFRSPPLPEGVIFYLYAMTIATIIGAIFFLPSIALNVALAFGAPLGLYAMNGRNKVVPKEARKAFIIPICMQFFAMFVLLSAGRIVPEIIPFMITRILAFFFAVYLTFYTATVLFSTAYRERMVMGSFAVVATICFWITAFGTLNF